MTYCPLCVPEMAFTEINGDEFVIVRNFPEDVIDTDSVRNNIYPTDKGTHIVREGWFKDMPKLEEYIVTWEIIHPIEDWQAKHLLDNQTISEETDLIQELLYKE